MPRHWKHCKKQVEVALGRFSCKRGGLEVDFDLFFTIFFGFLVWGLELVFYLAFLALVVAFF